MPSALELRAEPVPERLVVLRMGVNTLNDVALGRSCGDAYDEWGIHAFSVLPTPAQFERVRRHFRGPIDIPVWEGR